MAVRNIHRPDQDTASVAAAILSFFDEMRKLAGQIVSQYPLMVVMQMLLAAVASRISRVVVFGPFFSNPSILAPNCIISAGCFGKS